MPRCRGSHMDRRSFTCRELTQCYLERIEKINPHIKAVIETNPEDLVIADELDAERRTGIVRSGIHGIPFLVKDSTEAYSSRGGQNRNPYNLAEHPGGSSSGSASALAANMCAFSIGTETDESRGDAVHSVPCELRCQADSSVIFPADRNAVVGIKPTVGLTSTLGVIPEAPSMDTVGTFGRSVEDAATILDIIADESSLPDSQAVTDPSRKSYTSWLADKGALKGAKFGLPLKQIWKAASESTEHKSEYDALQTLIKQMIESGAQIFDVDFPSAEEIISSDGWNWAYAADVVAYNIEHTDTEGGIPGTHPAWPTGQDNFDKCIESKEFPNAVYEEALTYIRLKSREEGIDAALRHPGGELDGLIVPLQADGGAACSVAAKAAYPMITIPVGVNDSGVPFGLGIIQTAWKENLLVKYGSTVEDLVGPRHRPAFLNLDAENWFYIGSPPQ
ncbi:amidase signature enzyme [Ophiobolus disseminans]|uniref:Amidase signature enzyme n=1 Tax=Ophiobolus disseminans TaxID=1469910 RepID=A0A6A6ZUH0_9PLEO|nr:amidase signature enzyme [Ophiobolus disseminans]